MPEYIFHFLITIQIKHQNHEVQAHFAISARCIPALKEKLSNTDHYHLFLTRQESLLKLMLWTRCKLYNINHQ